MILDLKQTFKEVFQLKYFWVYLFIYTVLATISYIFSTLKAFPHNEIISNVFSICTYIPIAYLLVMIHNLLNTTESNNDENFVQNLGKVTKTAVKAFFAMILNTWIVFCFDIVFISIPIVIAMVLSIKIPKAALYIPITFIILLSVLAMFFITKLLGVAFSKNFAIKDTLKWITVAKIFFKKGVAKKTWIIFGIYVSVCLALVCFLFGGLFLFNLTIVYFAKTLLTNHYVLMSFLLNLSNVIVPFLGAMAYFILSAVTYNLFAKIYDESTSVKE